MKRPAILILDCSLILAALCMNGCGVAQKPMPNDSGTDNKVRRTNAKIENVYSDTWEAGEIKECTTCSDWADLLICDEAKTSWPGAFVHLEGEMVLLGARKDKVKGLALAEAFTRSTRFMVEFSDSHGRDPTPWPVSGTGRKETWWDCSKDKIISCSLGTYQK